MKINITSKLNAKGADHATVMNRAIETAKAKSTIDVPDGDFVLTSTIEVMNKGIRIEGRENSNFKVYHSGPAFVFNRSQNTTRTHISRISLMNHLNENNSPEQHGIVIHVPVTMEEVTIENFHGDGLHMTADINTNKYSDVSFCKIDSVTIRSCKGSGIYIAGGDSNTSQFNHVDVRDNGRFGIWDASFLGNAYTVSMAHNNVQGNYLVTDPNNRSSFHGCYSEGGSPFSYFDGFCSIHGGLLSGHAEWSDGFVLVGQAMAMIEGKMYQSGHKPYWKKEGTTPDPFISAIDFVNGK